MNPVKPLGQHSPAGGLVGGGGKDAARGVGGSDWGKDDGGGGR